MSEEKFSHKFFEPCEHPRRFKSRFLALLFSKNAAIYLFESSGRPRAAEPSTVTSVEVLASGTIIPELQRMPDRRMCHPIFKFFCRLSKRKNSAAMKNKEKP